MKIQVLNVQVGTKTAQSGKSYQNAEIAYKNLDSGKVESKNITQYSKVFKQVADAVATMFYDVVTAKNQNGFWDWEAFAPADSSGVIPPAANPIYSKPSPAPKSTFETPEERAKKQVYIIKQSSLSNAIETLSVGSKTPPDVAAVLDLAQKYTDWVLGSGGDLFEEPNDIEVE